MSLHGHRFGRLAVAVVAALGVALWSAGAAGAWRGHHGHGQGQSLWGFYDDVLRSAKYVT